MSSSDQAFTGIWLDHGDAHGQSFSHSEAEYQHGESKDAAPRMRHAFVERNGGKVGVWVPQHWSDEQVAQALETNW